MSEESLCDFLVRASRSNSIGSCSERSLSPCFYNRHTDGITLHSDSISTPTKEYLKNRIQHLEQELSQARYSYQLLQQSFDIEMREHQADVQAVNELREEVHRYRAIVRQLRAKLASFAWGTASGLSQHMSMAADGDDATGADFENDRSLNQILSVLDNDMTQHRERLEESLAKATDNAHRFEAKLADVSEENLYLSEALTEAQATNEEMQRQYNVLFKEMESLRCRHADDIQSLQTALEDAQSRYENEVCRSSNLGREVMSLRRELDDSHDTLFDQLEHEFGPTLLSPTHSSTAAKYLTCNSAYLTDVALHEESSLDNSLYLQEEKCMEKSSYKTPPDKLLKKLQAPSDDRTLNGSDCNEAGVDESYLKEHAAAYTKYPDSLTKDLQPVADNSLDAELVMSPNNDVASIAEKYKSFSLGNSPCTPKQHELSWAEEVAMVGTSYPGKLNSESYRARDLNCVENERYLMHSQSSKLNRNEPQLSTHHTDANSSFRSSACIADRERNACEKRGSSTTSVSFSEEMENKIVENNECMSSVFVCYGGHHGLHDDLLFENDVLLSDYETECVIDMDDMIPPQVVDRGTQTDQHSSDAQDMNADMHFLTSQGHSSTDMQTEHWLSKYLLGQHTLLTTCTKKILEWIYSGTSLLQSYVDVAIDSHLSKETPIVSTHPFSGKHCCARSQHSTRLLVMGSSAIVAGKVAGLGPSALLTRPVASAIFLASAVTSFRLVSISGGYTG